MDFYAILVSPLGLSVMGYSALMIVLAIVVYPLRRKMFSLAEELIGSGKLDQSGRAELNMLLDDCMSFRMGLLLPIAIIASIADDIIGRKFEINIDKALLEEQKFHHIILIYIISILAANPIAAFFSIPLAAISILVNLIFGKNTLTDAVEEPVIRLSFASS